MANNVQQASSTVFLIVSLLVSIPVAYYVWSEHLEYYWKTNYYTGYHLEGVAYLCDSDIMYKLEYVWTPRNGELLKSIGAKKSEIVYFEGRGNIRTKTEKTLFIYEFKNFSKGVQDNCDLILKPKSLTSVG